MNGSCSCRDRSNLSEKTKRKEEGKEFSDGLNDYKVGSRGLEWGSKWKGPKKRGSIALLLNE